MLLPPRQPPPVLQHTRSHPSSFLEYLSSSLIVVQVHQPPCILFDFSGINKPPGELNAVSDIRRAASPLPALLLVVVALFLSVTATIAEVALAAGGRDSVRDPGSGNGIGERGLPASCGEKPKAKGLAERQHVLAKKKYTRYLHRGGQAVMWGGRYSSAWVSHLTEFHAWLRRLARLGRVSPGVQPWDSPTRAPSAEGSLAMNPDRPEVRPRDLFSHWLLGFAPSLSVSHE